MDKSFESSLSNSQESSTALAGFFLQPHSFVWNHPEIFGSHPPRFLPTPDEVQALAEGKWGPLDASLTFINQAVYIKGSSKGFLLCSFKLQPVEQYCVCNPFTREWKALPVTKKVYKYVALAFYCEGNETSLDRLHFTVVQAGVGNPKEKTTTLVTETFSSKTGEWRELALTCASPFQLCVANVPALVANNVIYWKDISSNLVAHDPRTEVLEMIKVPELSRRSVTVSDVWAVSEGEIYYGRSDFSHFELWLFKRNGGRTEWKCITAVSTENMFSVQPGGGMVDVVGVKGVHPHNSKLVLLKFHHLPVWYNLESGEAEEIDDSSSICGAIPSDYFMYQYPSLS